MFVRSRLSINTFLSTFVLAVMLLASLGACSQQPDASSAGPIKIGVTVPLTGDSSSDGVALKQGYELWQDDMNQKGGLLGRKVQMIIKDDQSNAEKASVLYNNLVSQDHVDFLFSSFTDASTLAGARVAERNGYPFLEGAGEAPITFQQGLKNLFSVSLSATHYMDSFINYILSLPQNSRPKTVAYASSEDPFTWPQVLEVQDKFKNHITQVSYIHYPAETTDYNTIAQQIVAAHPDIVVLGTLSQEDCVPFIKYFKQQNFNPQAIIATSGPDQGSQFTDPIGGPQYARDIFVPNGGWFPNIKTYQNAQFVQHFVAKYGGSKDDISSDSVQAYSAGQVLEEAVNATHSFDHAKIIAELRSDSFDSLQGPVKFGADGENVVATAFLFQWQDKQLIPVFPANEAVKNPELHHYFDLSS